MEDQSNSTDRWGKGLNEAVAGQISEAVGLGDVNSKGLHQQSFGPVGLNAYASFGSLQAQAYHDGLQKIGDINNSRSDRKRRYLESTANEQIRQGVTPTVAVREASDAFDLIEELSTKGATPVEGAAA